MSIEPGTAAVPPSGKTNVLAIISLVAGLVSLPFFCCWPISVPLGLLAIILGVVGIGQINKRGDGGKALAIIGIVAGVAAILLFTLLVAIFGVVDQEALQKQIQQQQQQMQPGEAMNLEEEMNFEIDLGESVEPGDPAAPGDAEDLLPKPTDTPVPDPGNP